MKKIAIFLVGIILLFTGCSSKEKTSDNKSEERQKVALLLGVGGLGDQGYNDLAYEGAKKAEEELGIKVDHAEPKQISDFELLLRDFANSGEYKVIVGVGFDQVDAMNKVADEFPEQQFAIIDGNVEKSNVASYAFKEEEGSFLVGTIAGLMTKEGSTYETASQNIGFVGAMEIPILVKFQAGYIAGAKYINPNATVESGWVAGDNAFSDTTTAKEIALSQNNKNVGIIYHAAGGSGLGVFQAASEGNFYAIGCNSNQNSKEPDHIVASMLKRVDTASFNIIKDALEDNLKVGSSVELTLKEDGVGYTVEGSNIKLTDEDLKVVEAVKAKIASGEIVVPKTIEESNQFLTTNHYK